ncbi:hypothetical protein CASFOL_036601 [Castilleja foliolosa]|uniref:Uncharacterized protein n=1 Tax=Castilleja foliolosa TaxID=1961234 RepID=A0ABD3BS56_9LAMI
MCPLLNISYCPATEVDLSNGKKIAVIVYNSLGWKRTDVIRIPVITNNVIVKDYTGKMISSQLIPIVNDSAANEKYWLAFTAVVPPLGFSTYVITSANLLHVTYPASAPIKPITYTFGGTRNDSIQIGSGNLKLIYSGNDGKLTQYINSKSSVNVPVEQAYSYYAGHDGNNGSIQASGAYIFRPNATFKIQPEGKIPLTVFKGPLFDEIHQNISSWIYQWRI